MMKTAAERTPLISVIMPVYNAMPYLARALDTLLGQSLGSFELICVDDGSDDGSCGLLEEYASRDSRIRLSRREHAGAAAARNHGLAHAKAKYLYFADADDWFDPFMLERVCRRAEETQAEIVLFNAYIYYIAERRAKEPRHYIRQKMLPPKAVFSRRDCENGSLLYLTISAAWNKLYLRRFVQENALSFQNLPNSNDTLFMVATMSMAERITVLDERLMTHTTQNRNSLQGGREADPLSFLRAYEASYDFLQSSGLYDEVRQGFDNKFIWQAVDELNHSHRADARKRIVEAMRESSLMATGILDQEDDYYFTLGRKHFLASAMNAWDKGNFLRDLQVSDDDVEALEQSLCNPLPAGQDEEPVLEDIAQSYRAFLCWRRLSQLARRAESEDAAFAFHDRAENIRSAAVLSYARVKPEEQNFYFCLEPEDYYDFRFQVVQPAIALKKRQALERTEAKNDRLMGKNMKLKEKLAAIFNPNARADSKIVTEKKKDDTMIKANKLKEQEMIEGSMIKTLKGNTIRGALVNKQNVNDIRTAIIKVGPAMTFQVKCNKKRKNVKKFADFMRHGYKVTLTDEQLLSLDDPFKVMLIDKKTGKTVKARMLENPLKKALPEQKAQAAMIAGNMTKELKEGNTIRGVLVNKQDVNDIRTAILKVGPEIAIEVTCNKERKSARKFTDFMRHGYSVALTDEQLLSLDDPFEAMLIDKATGKTIAMAEIENIPKKALLQQKAELEKQMAMLDGNIVKDLKKNTIRGVLVNKQDVNDIRTAILKIGPEITIEVPCDKERKNARKFREFTHHGWSVALTDKQVHLLGDAFEVALIDKETGKTIKTATIGNLAKSL